MRQLDRVERVLSNGARGKLGLTIAQVAQRAGAPYDSVPKRVYDLRTEEGKTIYSNTRKIKGKKKTFYRFVG